MSENSLLANVCIAFYPTLNKFLLLLTYLSAITLLLYISAASLLELRSLFTQEKPISAHRIAPSVFPFMPVGHIATARVFGNAAETNNGTT